MRGDVLSILECPDDGSAVDPIGECLICRSCGREYKILGESFIEMLPSVFPEWKLRDHEPSNAEKFYRDEFFTAFTWKRNIGGWGDLCHASSGQRAFYEHQQRTLADLISLHESARLVDVSGAVGNHSIFVAGYVGSVINCDLHTPSIITAYSRRAANMICIRAPYLKMPFSSNTFDYAICTDTLIRGWNHEVKLLKEILRLLKTGGKAFVDFHNLVDFKKNSAICEYKISQVRQLLDEAGITQYTIYPFGHVPSKLVPLTAFYKLLDNICKLFLPCKRHIVIFASTVSEDA